MPGLCAMAAMAVAFAYALHAAWGAEWPHLYDALRDAGMAQSILYGRYPEDHVLLGKTLWFNPLMAWLVAAASWITHIRPPAMDVWMGPVVNLVLPVSLYLLARKMVGRWAAAAGVIMLLFVNSLVREHNPWTIASSNISTYTPWLFAPHVTQGLFCLALLAFLNYGRQPSLGGAMAAGALLGATFLGHTAPAVILGLIIVSSTAFDVAATPGRRARLHRVGHLALILAVAFTVSLPYTYSILMNYRFHIINWMPARYVVYDLDLKRLGQFIRDGLGVSTGLAVVGYVALWFSERKRERRLITCWIVFSFLFLAESYVAQLDQSGSRIPQIVPGHHFTILLSTAKALLAGYGAICLSYVAITIARHWKRLQNVVPDWTALAACIAIFATAIPAYPHWVEVAKKPRERMLFDYYDARDDMYHWILANTTPKDVFLTEDDDQLALLAVAPAARKVVAIMWIFSNPYVDCYQRREDRNAMFQALETHDSAKFDTLAKAYRVTYILIHAQHEQRVAAAGFEHIKEVHRAGPLILFSVM